jgi:hypothetical protein
MLRSSRELSSRLNINVHREPNRWRRATWWLAFWAGIGSGLWLWLQHVQGEHQIYQAGDVSRPHRLIENECWRCHTTWTPLQRLIHFSDDEHSIDNRKCEMCHRVGEHHQHQIPAHRDISCAACHQEHEGAQMLQAPSNRHCIACHADLPAHGGKGTFANRVSRFDEAGGHPEFHLKSLLARTTEGPAPTPQSPPHGALSSVAFFQRTGEASARWQDRGRIRFNHAVHLKAEYDASGQLVKGLIGKDRKLVDLSQRCEVCHEPDNERRFMKPISFERHCRECHPLLFDHERFPGQSVPHETPDIVRGFLTETYTLKALSSGERMAEGRGRASSSEDAVLRPLPGHRDFQRLSEEQASVVLNNVAAAESVAQQHRHSLFGYEATGGCRYCHEVEAAETKSPTTLADWKIVPTNIPRRWLPHANFHHEPHRLLSCTACHIGVHDSQSTGDVLIPGIDTCRACHAARPAEWVSKLPPSKPAAAPANPGSHHEPLRGLLSHTNRGAATNCIECHRYHDPARDRWNGPFSP